MEEEVRTSPERGERVKLFIKGGLIEEGIVLYWSSGKSVLRSLTSNNVLILQNTGQDVLAVQILFEEPEKQKPQGPVLMKEGQKPFIPKVAVTEELKPDQYYKDESLRAKNLAELYKEKAKIERENARKLVTSFEPTGFGVAPYDPRRATIPRKLQSVPFHTKKKT